jgi:hypothetical protein
LEILVLAPFAAVEAYHYPLMALARELGVPLEATGRAALLWQELREAVPD